MTGPHLDELLAPLRANRELWQAVVNERFRPERAVEQPWHGSDSVTVLVVWEGDGREEIETVALAHTGDLVLVELDDPRRFPRHLWLHRDHVKET